MRLSIFRRQLIGNILKRICKNKVLKSSLCLYKDNRRDKELEAEFEVEKFSGEIPRVSIVYCCSQVIFHLL